MELVVSLTVLALGQKKPKTPVAEAQQKQEKETKRKQQLVRAFRRVITVL